MKSIKDYIKPFILAFFIICLFNKMAVILDFYIPVNIIDILAVGILGISGLIMLIFIYYIIL